METYVIEFYLYCEWEDLPPTYRVYLNDELMTERTYIWHNDSHVLQERVPVMVEDGTPLNIKIEQVGPHSGKFSVKRKFTPPLVNFNIA